MANYNGLVIIKEGTKYYYKCGKMHRLNGPALIYRNFSSWYYNGYYVSCTLLDGRLISRNDMIRKIKLMIFK